MTIRYEELNTRQRDAINLLEQWLDSGCPHTKVEDYLKGEITILGFNMNQWTSDYNLDEKYITCHSKDKPSDCGTVCCMGGYLSLVDPETDWDNMCVDEGDGGLARLFYPDGYVGGWDYIKPAQALAVLRKWKETGEADWSNGE